MPAGGPSAPSRPIADANVGGPRSRVHPRPHGSGSIGFDSCAAASRFHHSPTVICGSQCSSIHSSSSVASPFHHRDAPVLRCAATRTATSPRLTERAARPRRLRRWSFRSTTSSTRSPSPGRSADDLDRAARRARGPRRPPRRRRHVQHARRASAVERYLEIIGPDPEQPDPERPRPFGVDDLTAPRARSDGRCGDDDIDAAIAASRGRRLRPGPRRGDAARRAPTASMLLVAAHAQRHRPADRSRSSSTGAAANIRLVSIPHGLRARRPPRSSTRITGARSSRRCRRRLRARPCDHRGPSATSPSR